MDNAYFEKLKEEFKDDPREVTSYTLPSGQVVITVGELDVKRFIKKALEQILEG